MLARARRPLILSGGGIHLSQGYDALLAFAEAQSIPVAHTMSGKGGIACTHPLSTGLFGRYSRIANELIEASDCLLVVGCKFGEIATKRFALPSRHIPMIHLEIVAEEIGRCLPADVALWGDARAGLEDLAQALAGDARQTRAARAGYIAEIPKRMTAWREEAAARLDSGERPIHMARLCRELNHALPADSILVADGGFAGHWTGLLYDTKTAGRHFIPDRGLASIGYGLPGGIGAALAAPQTPGRRDRRRRRLQHDPGRARNRAPRRHRAHHRRRQQRRLGLRQGVAIRDVPRPLPILRPRRDGLRRDRPRDGLRRHPRRGPGPLPAALAAGLAERTRPTVLDVVVTRDPARMLPAVDNRTVEIKQGDRVA